MFAEWKRVSLMWFNSNTSQDLAKAFLLVLTNEKASKQVFNISGEKYVTFDGLARACAKVTLKICLQNGKKRNQKLKNFMKWLEFYDYLHVFVLCVLIGCWVSWAWDCSLQPQGVRFWQKESIPIPWPGKNGLPNMQFRYGLTRKLLYQWKLFHWFMSISNQTAISWVFDFSHVFHPIWEESYQVAPSVTNHIADCFPSTSDDMNNSNSSDFSTRWT